jgi:hypothetical protein
MSAPAPSWRAQAARWAHRAAAASAGALFDAAVDSLGLGKRCVAWLAHSSGARAVAVVAVALAIAGGAAWAAGRARRVARETTSAASVVAPSTRAMPRSSTASARDPSPPG